RSERARGTRPFAPRARTPVLGRGAGGNDLGAAVIGAKQTRYAQAEPFSWLALKRWRALWRPAMVGRLLIGVGQAQHVAVVVGPSPKGDPRRKVVARKSRRNSDRGNKY